MVRARELPIDINASATEMARAIFGDGTQIYGASYSGDYRSSGIYSDGLGTMSGVAPSDSGVILSTGEARDITNSRGQANDETNTSTNTWGETGNDWFDAAAGTRTYDAAYLDVDFVPDGNVMTMRFVFASEEYPEYQTGIYQDFIGVWINGAQVELDVGDGDTDPNNLNAETNQNLYVDNADSDYNTEMDGFTVTMTMTIPVVAGQLNSIRIGIADVSDSNYDSNILIAADSVQTTLVAMTDNAQLYPEGTVEIDALANDENSTGGALTITHVNSKAVSVGDTVILATGQTVTLTPAGTLEVTGDGDVETVNFTYTAASSTGATDVGFVTVGSVPCFVAGTRIATADGPVPVEALEAGMMVRTKDRGHQPLRWIGQRTVAAAGAFAPVEIAPHTFGQHSRLRVSPQHRILVRNRAAELLFGEAEVLIAARHLVDGGRVRQVEGGEVTYVHLLFDRHEIVFANGLASESFLPGPQVRNIFAEETLHEICTLFPELDPLTGAGYPPAARRILSGHEARALSRVAA
ncbi:Hint domain-containing protein [Roseivivax marinus]|uniref:Hint domain-containing protein n=1 Tax=Roseivivax marinus TaxID=1379903 RepID=UPI001F041CE2|nr:Hint domain-containing protein [Roseivivax marinus]UMA64479.1 Hint domain-containing protein [Roseivivax marinus]